MIEEEAKRDAFEFLSNLERSLGATGGRPLAPAFTMEPEIRAMNAGATNDDGQKHLRWPEAAFLNEYILPALAESMKVHQQLTNEQIQESLLSECYRGTPELSRMTPARTAKHPFSKVMGTSANAIYDGWEDEQNGSALVQSCPDFAVRHPFAHRIVFEGKYFSNGSQKHANAQLVVNLYQAFFYRGLPYAKSKPPRPDWDYDYSCLVAYDASPEGTLKRHGMRYRSVYRKDSGKARTST